MKKEIQKYRIELLIVSYIAISGLLINFVAKPLVGRIIQKSDSIQEANIDSEIESKRIEKIPQMEESYSSYQSKKEALEVIFNNPEQFEIIKNLEEIAQETGNSIIKLKVDNADKNILTPKKESGKEGEEKSIIESLSSKDYLSFQMSLAGNYDSLIYLIQKMENNRNYMNILSISVMKQMESDIKKKDNAQDSSDLFSANRLSEANSPEKKPDSDTPPAEDKKEVLSSEINFIVYIKK